MSNFLNWALNPWAAYAQDKAKSYVIGQHTRPDPDAPIPKSDPASGKLLSPMSLVTVYKVDCIQNGISSVLGEYSSRQAAQAAAQTDASS